MIVFPLANANASVISVTGTAATLLKLIDTAGSTSHVFRQNLDAVNITPEDGDIRIMYDPSNAALAPTATKGFLIKQGATHLIRFQPLYGIKLISTTGTVSCSVQIGTSEPGEGSAVTGGGGSITSIVPGTGATNLGKAEDSVHASGDVGVQILSKRTDTPASSAGTDGDYATVNTDGSGNTWTSLGTKIAGEDISRDVLKTEFRGTPTYISTATTTTAKTGAGVLHSVTVQGGTTGTIIIYDNTAGSGTILASFDSTVALATYILDIAFATGCTIVTSAATKLTVSVE